MYRPFLILLLNKWYEEHHQAHKAHINLGVVKLMGFSQQDPKHTNTNSKETFVILISQQDIIDDLLAFLNSS